MENIMPDQVAVHLNMLVQWLRERHSRIMEVEAGALSCLDAGDTEGHNQKMRDKAELLSTLHEDAKTLLEPLPEEVRLNLASDLNRFAASAQNALQLNSVFYMSALLYPGDHKQGQPDDLLIFLDHLARERANFA
ncbi:hypothetical protein AGMMS50248_03190 [Deltaproteobacteria bacterium]|nr:hypothetical protein AGMMS50248_03190 [Deltaproteobacteria bacterium]